MNLLLQSISTLLFFLPLLFALPHFGTTQTASFCSRLSNSQSCPTPPTFDSIVVPSYLGKWYELGSTASFKLLTEAGLVCDQANYSLSASGNVALVNSGLRVIHSLASAEVATVSLSARGVCSNARHICTNVAKGGPIRRAIQEISYVKENLTGTNPGAAMTLADVLDQLTPSLHDVEPAMEAVAHNIKYLQYLNGQISQGNATDLKETVDLIHNSVDTADEKRTLVEEFVKNLESAEEQILQVSETISVPQSEELQEAVKSMQRGANSLSRNLLGMKVALEGIQAASSTLRLDGQPIDNGKISSVKGEAEQNKSSAGKLEVTINGIKSPYWVLAVDGEASEGYNAALVFSCTDNKIVGVAKSLYILSRTPKLSEEVVGRFLSLADSYGILTGCDDPFLFTVQRGGDCGRAASSSSSSSVSFE